MSAAVLTFAALAVLVIAVLVALGYVVVTYLPDGLVIR